MARAEAEAAGKTPEEVEKAVFEAEEEAEMNIEAAARAAAARKKFSVPAHILKEREAAEAKKKADEEKAAADFEAWKESEKKAWAEAKAAAEVRAAEKAAASESSSAVTVLQAIEALASKAVEHEAHVNRLHRIERTIGGELAAGMRQRARRRSKDLQEEIASMLGDVLEDAFKQFDKDGNGTLDEGELSAAYLAAGIPISEESLRSCMKVLDTNGDGVVDLEEFKALALRFKMMDAISKADTVGP